MTQPTDELTPVRDLPPRALESVLRAFTACLVTHRAWDHVDDAWLDDRAADIASLFPWTGEGPNIQFVNSLWLDKPYGPTGELHRISGRYPTPRDGETQGEYGRRLADHWIQADPPLLVGQLRAAVGPHFQQWEMILNGHVDEAADLYALGEPWGPSDPPWGL